MKHRDIDTSLHIVAMKVKEDNVNNVHGKQEAMFRQSQDLRI